MIITVKVKNAVDEEKKQLFHHVGTPFDRLPPGGIERDHHVAEQIVIHPAELPFPHGKGDHIRRLVYLPVVPVNLPDLAVVSQ